MTIHNPKPVMDKLVADLEKISVSPCHSAEKKEFAHELMACLQLWDEDQTRAQLTRKLENMGEAPVI